MDEHLPDRVELCADHAGLALQLIRALDCRLRRRRLRRGVHAARAAARLGAALGLELVIVHAYEHPSSSAALPAAGVAPPIDYATLAEEQRAGAERLLDAVARELADEAPARTRIAIGDPAAALDRSAQEERAELIVVGTHGRAPLAAALLGSTSARLAACASRPVVLVPRGVSLRLEASAAPAGTRG